MTAYENDTLVIPEKYKKMSAPELEIEKKKVLKELLEGSRIKKKPSKNANNIVFHFK